MNRYKDLANIENPVWVMSGRYSFQTRRTLARSLADKLPNSRFIEYEDCGHVPYAEKPEEFAREVTSQAATSSVAQ